MMIRRLILQQRRYTGRFRDLHPGPRYPLPLCFSSSTSRYGVSFGDDGSLESSSEDDDYAEVDPETEAFLAAGKSHYRRRESLPEWMSQKRREICQHRTKAQIRRCLKKWMVQAGRDLEKKRRYRLRSLDWKETPKKIGATRVSDGTLDVHAYGPEETIAYMHYFYPGKFALHQRVFRDMSVLLPQEYRPKKILDFGCGPGTAAAAALEVWGDSPDMLYTGVDMSQSMLDAAKVVLDGRQIQSIFYDRVGEMSRRALQDGQTYDLIVCSFTLTELASDHLRRTATQLLYELLSVDGMFVIIESGDPSGSHTTRTARRFLLETGESGFIRDTTNSRDKRVSRQEAEAGRTVPKVLAPCSHSGACPLSGGAWCSFSQRVEGGLLRKTNEEKFSYVVLRKEKVGLGEEKGDEGHNRLSEEVHLEWPLRKEEWGRIIRSPLKKRGHVVMDVCYPDGALRRSVVTKGKEGRLPLFYRAARKSQWGGLYPAYNFAETTEILPEEEEEEEPQQ